MEIEAEFRGLDKPTSFGTEYLTYVLWAISPEGRSVNVGEVLVGDNHRSKLDVTTDLQAFALIVTAEPYYAVRRPSNVVIVENAIRPDTVGTSEAVDAKYELIDRGGYIPTGYHFDPVVLNSKLPLEFFEARNAVRIAKSAGAETYAASSYEKAVSQMKQADDLGTMKHVDRKALISASREVVQTADDSREIAVKRIDADRMNADKDREAAKLANARKLHRKKRNAGSYGCGSSNRRCKPPPRRRGSGYSRSAAATTERPGGVGSESLPLRLTRIKPPRKLNRHKETRRRSRSETVSPPQTRISNSSKPCRIAKNCAPNCCNNST